jgi:hypothetical protein
MSHQPFETWILTEDPLTAEQLHSLHAHLGVCRACKRLSAASSDVDQLLRTIPPMRPANGFTTRWQARLAVRNLQVSRQRQSKQSWWFFYMNAFAALLFLVFLLAQINILVDSPISFLILSGVHLATTWLSFVSAIQEILTTFSSVVLRIVPQFWWVVITIGISILSLIWLISLRKLLFPRRSIQ